jgi:hypothetical protein
MIKKTTGQCKTLGKRSPKSGTRPPRGPYIWSYAYTNEAWDLEEEYGLEHRMPKQSHPELLPLLLRVRRPASQVGQIHSGSQFPTSQPSNISWPASQPNLHRESSTGGIITAGIKRPGDSRNSEDQPEPKRLRKDQHSRISQGKQPVDPSFFWSIRSVSSVLCCLFP